MTYLQHITLNTGHVVRQHRDDVAGTAIGRVQDMINRALDGERAEVLPGYAMTADGDGPHNLIATIWAEEIADEPLPLVTIGVALRSRSAARLWQAFNPPGNVAMPQAPWIAVHLWPTLPLVPEATEWLGDFERVLGWAWESRQ